MHPLVNSERGKTNKGPMVVPFGLLYGLNDQIIMAKSFVFVLSLFCDNMTSHTS